MSIERVPPQSLEAEQATLGSMLLERNALLKALEILRPEDYYYDNHRIIF
ncbi:MAG TPA: replicative DNA helicase, partial [Candidatus Atribacteria bacterium]|nr:replicative DNA helicase [Candidatus Atribacteria bacterium]